MEPQQNDGGGCDAAGLSIVIPAYNEARRLPGTLPRVVEYASRLREPVEIIVVDDGSSDGTADVAAAVSVARGGGPVRNPRGGPNHGKGPAVRRGVLAAGLDHVLFSDVDLSTPIEEAAKLRDALTRGADVAIGSRRLAESDVQVHQPWLRELAGRTFSGVVSLILLPGIRDSQCGFKAFRRATAPEPSNRPPPHALGFDAE